MESKENKVGERTNAPAGEGKKLFPSISPFLGIVYLCLAPLDRWD